MYAIRSYYGIGKNVEEEKTLLQKAETNYQIVSNGRGTHNFELSMELLESAQSALDKILGPKKQ